MTNLIVLSFNSEAQAIEASHKLIELESFGDISIFEKGIVRKDHFGNISVLQSETTDGLRTFSGMALGTVIGALGGPVGLLIGMLAGTVVGVALDSDHIDFSESFVSKVNDRLQPGNVALIAEISEDNPGLVDSVFEARGTTVYRSNVDYEYNEYEDSEIEEFDRQIAEDRKEIKTAVSSEKLKIQQKIAQLKEKRRERIASLKEKHNSRVAKFKMSIRENKKSRLRHKIDKHQARITELEDQLRKLEG